MKKRFSLLALIFPLALAANTGWWFTFGPGRISKEIWTEKDEVFCGAVFSPLDTTDTLGRQDQRWPALWTEMINCSTYFRNVYISGKFYLDDSLEEDNIAVFGKSRQRHDTQNAFGIAGWAICQDGNNANAYGTWGFAVDSGSGNAYGGWFQTSNIGTGIHYGVYTESDSFGIYAKTTSPSKNWAGYFEGSVFISNSLTIGDTLKGLNDTLNILAEKSFTVKSKHTVMGDATTNSAIGNWSASLAGASNAATGDYSIVVGGECNAASADYDVVCGGLENIASGEASSIVGGYENIASNFGSHVGGGGSNESTGEHANVSGGYDNSASNNSATIAGGFGNSASGIGALVSGGYSNHAEGEFSGIGWGTNDSVYTHGSYAGGGYCKVWGDPADSFSIAIGYGSIADSVFNSVALNGVTEDADLTTGTHNLNVHYALSTQREDTALANGNNNDITCGGRSFVKITGPTGVFSITGIANGFDGKELVIYNSVAQNMTIEYDDANSVAANRIITMTGADLVSTAAANVTLKYDEDQSRWIVIGWRP